MANILIVGFEKLEAEKLQDQIDAVMRQLGKDKQGESATVILDAQTKWCGGKGRTGGAGEQEGIRPTNQGDC